LGKTVRVHRQSDDNTVATKPEETYKSKRINQDKSYKIGISKLETGIQLEQGKYGEPWE
jgi:hypothetical protein